MSVEAPSSVFPPSNVSAPSNVEDPSNVTALPAAAEGGGGGGEFEDYDNTKLQVHGDAFTDVGPDARTASLNGSPTAGNTATGSGLPEGMGTVITAGQDWFPYWTGFAPPADTPYSIELWAKHITSDGGALIDVLGATGFSTAVAATHRISWNVAGTDVIATADQTDMTVNTWYHHCFTFDGASGADGRYRYFRDGVHMSTRQKTQRWTANADFRLRCTSNVQPQYCELRVVVGSMQFPSDGSNFTPRTTKYADS